MKHANNNLQNNAEITQQLAKMILAAQSVVAFSGAGISTQSGIPDFRGPGGVWSKYNPSQFHIKNILGSAEQRREYWKYATELYNEMLLAEPNPSHQELTRLQNDGRLNKIITQNIDGLHQRAGSQDVIELHGTALFVNCLSCGWREDRKIYQPLVNPDPPPCSNCGGIIKPATISFGQNLDPQVLEYAITATENSDLFIVIGSSLTVYPAAGLPTIALDNAAKLVIINHEPTPLDPMAELVINQSSAEILSATADIVL